MGARRIALHNRLQKTIARISLRGSVDNVTALYHENTVRALSDVHGFV